jgi:predicted regulator of Ras-like GTPase activity (Roadblock/LC7/MglB family)
VELTAVPANGIGIESSLLALSYVGDPAAAGGVLHAGSSLRTVLWPPLVVLTGRPPNKNELEKFRRQGAIHVTQAVDNNTLNVFRKLVEAAVTDRRPVVEGALAGLMSSLEKARVSGLLVVACPHWMGLSVYPWENSSLFYCSANEAEKCRGWAGRIYIINGSVHHVETPSAKGHVALAQMLALTEGTIYRYPFFVSPEVTEPLGTVSSCLAKSALENEHTVPRAESFAQRSAPPPIPPQRSPQSSSESKMAELDPLLTSAGLSGAAMVTSDGRLLSTSGQIDGEAVAAVATYGLTMAEQVGAMLPLGGIVGICVGGRGASLYVRKSNMGIVVAQKTSAQIPTLRLVKDLSRFGI